MVKRNSELMYFLLHLPSIVKNLVTKYKFLKQKVMTIYFVIFLFLPQIAYRYDNCDV